MTEQEVLTLLSENQNERGKANWDKLGPRTAGLESFGIGLTQLRKFAKKIGRDHDLAQTLWQTNVYDAKVIGLLIDEPKRITRKQVEAQVEQLNGGMLSHVFASCDATLAKTPMAFEVSQQWIAHDDPVRRKCGFTLLYELSKTKKKIPGFDDDFLLDMVSTIQDHLHDEPDMWVREGMMTALMGIGKRNKTLNAAAIDAATSIGDAGIDYGPDNSCEPLDVLKHLTSDYLKKKLGT